jgi:hypothetical protein
MRTDWRLILQLRGYLGIHLVKTGEDMRTDWRLILQLRGYLGIHLVKVNLDNLT